MRIERHNGYRVVVGAPVPPQADAITLGSIILMRSAASGHQALLAHELVHVRQFGELGPVRFIGWYVGSYLRLRLGGYGHMAAYRRIPLEVEASWLSRLHPVAALEPNARAARDRLARRGPVRRVTSPRPAPAGGTYRNRSRRLGQAAAKAYRPASADTSR